LSQVWSSGGGRIGDDKGNALIIRENHIEIFDSSVGGIAKFAPENWVGNTKKPSRVKYGFAIMTLSEIASKANITNDIFWLQIPPQAFSQKEVFATNIQATRKGVVVETEGVVFKDIVLQGTTGVFPGIRGNNSVPQANFQDFTKPPKAPAGVDEDTGMSRDPVETKISGYEEFIRLRQYFLRYAEEKVRSDGDRFLLFVNTKDNQILIVEPLEFDMQRNSKRPLEYNYRIVLKAVGSYDYIFEIDDEEDEFNLLDQLLNVVNNVTALVGQIERSIQLIQRFSENIVDAVVNPLKQLGFALQDLNDGISTIMSLPEVLWSKVTEESLAVREAYPSISQTVSSFSGRNSNRIDPVTGESATADQGGVGGSDYTAITTGSTSATEVTVQRINQQNAFNRNRLIVEQLENGTRSPVPRSFVEDLSNKIRALGDDLADFINLGSDGYNELFQRVVTAQPGELKEASDDEIILLGAIFETVGEMNYLLSTNDAFKATPELAYEKAQAIFEDNLRTQKPSTTREITILQEDTLERIALREYGDVLRWVDLVILNNLKPPYIDPDRTDSFEKSRVKKPGENLLVGRP
jgi:hypothetical protein